MVEVNAKLKILLTNLLKSFNTLLDCPVRFSGHYGGLKIHHFIEYVISYKRIKCIPDEQALQELGHLLTENAHTWWLRRKCHFAKWSEALTALQNEYIKQRPVHLVYKDIFNSSYDEYSCEEEFINDKYELFNELPDPKPSEKCKLDMIFALFPKERQLKLEYTNITNIWELKEHIHKLRYEQIRAASNMQNGNQNGNCSHTDNKDTLNRIGGTLTEENHQSASGETPTQVHIINDPVIKVRRTEDLMPQIKQEDGQQNRIVPQDEFISTELPETGTNENSNNFEIDTDIMNQINNIIDESEMLSDSVCNNMQISSVMRAADDSPAGIAFLLNGETTIEAEVGNETNDDTSKNTIPIKKKIRCTFCKKQNHTAQMCFKKAKLKQLFPEKFDDFGNLINRKRLQALAESLNNPEIVSTSSSTNNGIANSSNDITRLAPVNTIISPSVSNVPAQLSTSNTAVSRQLIISSVSSANTALFVHNAPLPTTLSTSTHITTLSSVPPTLSNPAALTTKLIAPINGPSTNKQLTVKLRNSNGTSPKCHQCGTVGFYKSICPNCSPIYNSNQFKS